MVEILVKSAFVCGGRLQARKRATQKKGTNSYFIVVLCQLFFSAPHSVPFTTHVKQVTSSQPMFLCVFGLLFSCVLLDLAFADVWLLTRHSVMGVIHTNLARPVLDE